MIFDLKALNLKNHTSGSVGTKCKPNGAKMKCGCNFLTYTLSRAVMDLNQDFEYKEKGRAILFKATNEEGLICYNCGKKYKKITVHFSIKEICRGNVNIDQLKVQYNEYIRSKLLHRQRERQRKYMNKLKEELGTSTVKKDQNERRTKSMDKRIEQLGSSPVKKDQNERNKKCLDKKRELGYPERCHNHCFCTFNCLKLCFFKGCHSFSKYLRLSYILREKN